jgi:hypothetical protein
MKALSAAIFVLLIGASSVMASTTTYSGIASQRDHLVVPFTTTVVGDITATATVTSSKNNDSYIMYVINSASIPVCGVRHSVLLDGNGPLTCTALNAPAGDYTVEFWLYRGGGSRPVRITLETP